MNPAILNQVANDLSVIYFSCCREPIMLVQRHGFPNPLDDLDITDFNKHFTRYSRIYGTRQGTSLVTDVAVAVNIAGTFSIQHIENTELQGRFSC